MKFEADCAGCFAGLSCGIRIEIINLLKEKDRMSVLEITKHFKVTQPTITYHLKYLKQVGILSSRKKGRKVYYFINPKRGKGECGLFR